MKYEDIVKQLHIIQETNEHSLEAYAQSVSMSGIDDKTREYLYRAIDIRREELRQITPALVEHGEHKGEIA